MIRYRNFVHSHNTSSVSFTTWRLKGDRNPPENKETVCVLIIKQGLINYFSNDRLYKKIYLPKVHYIHWHTAVLFKFTNTVSVLHLIVLIFLVVNLPTKKKRKFIKHWTWKNEFRASKRNSIITCRYMYLNNIICIYTFKILHYDNEQEKFIDLLIFTPNRTSGYCEQRSILTYMISLYMYMYISGSKIF